MDAGLHDDRSPAILPRQPRALHACRLPLRRLCNGVERNGEVQWRAQRRRKPDVRATGVRVPRTCLPYCEHSRDGVVPRESQRQAGRARRALLHPTSRPSATPHAEDFRLPAAVGHAAEPQLLAALFDTARHGLAQLSQQIPVRPTDDKAVPRRASEGRSHSREGPDEEKQGKVGRRPLDKASIREQAIWDKGMLATQNTVVGLQDASTRERLIEDFELDEDEDSLGRS
jgi:hypothetical protein